MGTISLFPGRTKLPTHTDAEALASDWRKVGEDMRTVTEQYALDDPPPWINRHRHG
jgi:hypothetical protein